MNHLSAHLSILTLATAATLSNAQSFPIHPVLDPTYPFVDPAFAGFDWQYPAAGTLQILGDLNNDGREDLLVMFIEYDKLEDVLAEKRLWVYYQNELAEFDQPVPFELTIKTPGLDEPRDIVIHDHNHDGINDIILPLGDHLVPFISTPAGFVEAQPLFLEEFGYDYDRVLYVDLDHDGDDDLIRWQGSTWSVGSIEIWLYQGAAGYINIPILEEESPSPRGRVASDMKVSDFDGDGDLDILLTGGYGIGWIEKSAFGYEYIENPNIIATNFSIDVTGAHTTMADINADGLIDFVTFGEGPNRTGYGFFLAPFTQGEAREIPFFEYPDFDTSFSYDFSENFTEWNQLFTSPGDLDGDGTDELIYKPYKNLQNAWRFTDPLNHNGRFGVSADIPIKGEVFNEFYNTELNLDPSYNYQDAYFDINHDGVKDRFLLLTVTNPEATPETIHDITNVGFQFIANIGNPFDRDTILNERNYFNSGGHTHITHADFNDNGQSELFLTQSKDLVRINPDTGFLQLDDATRFPGSGGGFRTVLAPLNSDPGIDSITLSNSVERSYPKINLDISFEGFDRPGYSNVPLFWSDQDLMLQKANIFFDSQGSSFAIADIDNDNDNDIIIRGNGAIKFGDEGPAVLTWINDGEAYFTLGTLTFIDSNFFEVHSIETLDHDQDGDQDLLCITAIDNDNFGLAIYDNDGTGAFTHALTIPLAPENPNQRGFHQYWIITQDIDLDGLEDAVILFRDGRNDNDICILYGSPTGLSAPIYYQGGGAAEVISADLDGNGLPDLITCAYQNIRTFKSSLSIMFQTAPRVYAPMISIVDTDFAGVDAVDLNNDGVLDLVGCNTEPFQNTRRDANIHFFYSVPAPCAPDLNLDKSIDFFDISLFIQLFVEQRPLADFNHDSVFSFFDISAFIESYNAGCDTP